MRPRALALTLLAFLFVIELFGPSLGAFQEPSGGTSARPGADELKARDRHALLNVRTVVMAGKTYAAANGGLFGELACLTSPESCGKPWPADAAFPLDPSYQWEGVKLGYVRRFVAGPRAADED